MITDITMNGVASYKQPTTLHTDKFVNLIYGLNGTGKSTLSEFLRHREDAFYEHCSLTSKCNGEEEEILVYNDKYVQDVFYEKDDLKGIFTISQENAEAYKKIESLRECRQNLQNQQKTNEEERKEKEVAHQNAYLMYINSIWKIKQDYAGGDRVLEYCLRGYMGSKDALAQAIKDTPKPKTDIIDSIETLKSEASILERAEGMNPILLFPEYTCPELTPSDLKLLEDVITGNKDSRVSKLIDELNASDWVKQGLTYDSQDVCPFCQRPYNDDLILNELKGYFSHDYEVAMQRIHEIQVKIVTHRDAVISWEGKYDEIECIKLEKDKYLRTFNQFLTALNQCVDIVQDKEKNPGKSVKIPDIVSVLQELNQVIRISNDLIKDFNQKVTSIKQQRELIKDKFWKRMRWEYDSEVKKYEQANKDYDTYLTKQYDVKANAIKNQLKSVTDELQREMLKVVNVEEAINHINDMLIDMGITDFKIDKTQDNEEFYHIVRDTNKGPVFKTLSEGEKVIISFLYFLESCRGLQSKMDTKKKRIIVIDDPISSLSHMYTYNVGRLIWRICYPSIKKSRNDCSLLEQPFEQVFVLTHSLYFFYELIELDSDKRHFYQNLFRLKKTKDGSQIEEMHYNDIQNEYQEYWSIINNPQEHPALIANCMRNVLEYFFGFVEGKELSAIFSCEAMKNPKYQAFNRFINRESHSIPTNLSDFKEFDYTLFMEALSMIFQDNGYERHFNTMRKSSLS